MKTKKILDEKELKQKLRGYNYKFDDESFNRLMNLGYYHVTNSDRRKDNKIKSLSDLLNLYDLDMRISKIIFNVIVEINFYIEQKFLNIALKKMFISKDSSFRSYIKCCSPVESSLRKELNSSEDKLLEKCIENYSKDSAIFMHFKDKNCSIPLWAIFESLTMGKFIHFLRKDWSDKKIIVDLNDKLNLRDGLVYKDLRLVSKILDVFVQIRNNIAHNNPIIDCRFLKSNKEKNGKQYFQNSPKNLKKIIDHYIYDVLSNEKIISEYKSIQNKIEMNKITDFLILIMSLFSIFKMKKYYDTEFIKQLIDLINVINENNYVFIKKLNLKK